MVSPAATTTIRRRRILLFAALIFGVIFFFGVPWELPAALRDVSISGVSRASVGKLRTNDAAQGSTPSSAEQLEILGLLHLVTGDAEDQHVLSNAARLDPNKPVDMKVYAAGVKGLDWKEEARALHEKFPVIVFSKTYCPYSRIAKNILADYNLLIQPKVIEVDLRDDAGILKTLLTRLTHQSTFPNVFIEGVSVGGSDKLKELHETGALETLLIKARVLENPNK